MVNNIWVAAADDQRAVVEQHISSGSFTPNSKDPNGYTPMHAAASYGHIDLLKYLVSKGGDINITDAEGDTPLHHVEDVTTARFVVEELKANYKVKNADGLTAAEYIEEEDDFPDVAAYLRSLAHDKPEDGVTEANEFVTSLPAPGTVDGHQIRYTMEENAQDDSPELAERRKKIAAILDGENPEEALRELVQNAVLEGLAGFREESSEPAKKRR